jgi:hypothetical protein
MASTIRALSGSCCARPCRQWTPLSIGLEKPRRFRTQGSLNEHVERHKSATGPNSVPHVTYRNSGLRNHRSTILPTRQLTAIETQNLDLPPLLHISIKPLITKVTRRFQLTCVTRSKSRPCGVIAGVVSWHELE